MLTEYFCKDCNKFHVEVAEITQEEADSLKFLDSRIRTANNFVETNQGNDNVLKAAMEVVADNQFTAGKWWDEISKKYGFEISTTEYFIDFDRKTIYFLKDEAE